MAPYCEITDATLYPQDQVQKYQIMSQTDLEVEYQRLYCTDQEQRANVQSQYECITKGREETAEKEAERNFLREQLYVAEAELLKSKATLDENITNFEESNRVIAENIVSLKIVAYLTTDIKQKPFASMTLKEIQATLPEVTVENILTWTKEKCSTFFNFQIGHGFQYNPEYQA